MPAATALSSGYDNSVRLLARRDIRTLCGWLGRIAEGAPVHRAGMLPAVAPQQVDLLTEIAPQVLLHVEFERFPGPDTARRMLEYRTLMMRLHPAHRITQHVVVLDRGIMPRTIEDPPQLTYRIDVTYLRDQDPEGLLGHPSLVPLAVLARASRREDRVRILRRALAVIRGVRDPARRHDLAYIAATLAGLHLDPSTIWKLTREAGMPFTLDQDTVAGRIIKAQGRAEGRAETYADLLRASFGADPRIDSLALGLTRIERTRAVDIARRVTSLDELAALVPQEPAASE